MRSLCVVDGCERFVKGHGYCATHYARWRKDGHPGPAAIRVKRYDVSCGVDGCERRAQRNGLCNTHHARVERHGDPGPAELMHVVRYDGQLCSVEDCERTARSRGWCVPHWKRWNRWGDPLIKRPTEPAQKRFRAQWKVGASPADRPGLGPCHLWQRGTSPQGYGVFSVGKGVQILAHRFAYSEVNGEIPEGLVIDHLCRVRTCVNPNHLEPVTNLENLRRGAGYGLRNGMRTCCIHGHEYTPENTYTSPRGDIRCRKCGRDRGRQRAGTRRKAA